MRDSPTPEADRGETRDAVGWMPAVVAVGAAVLMILFITCGVGTYLLFQKRAELAGRTLRQTLIPMVEQSNLAPEEKTPLVERLETVAREAESGALENWQAAGVMQRLIEIPILEWGDLDAALATAAERPEWSEEDQQHAEIAVQRVKRAVELGRVSTIDLNQALSPLMQPSQNFRGESLDLSADTDTFRDVFHRCDLLADRAEVPERPFEDVRLDDIVRRQIEAGREEGAR